MARGFNVQPDLMFVCRHEYVYGCKSRYQAVPSRYDSHLVWIALRVISLPHLLSCSPGSTSGRCGNMIAWNQNLDRFTCFLLTPNEQAPPVGKLCQDILYRQTRKPWAHITETTRMSGHKITRTISPVNFMLIFRWVERKCTWFVVRKYILSTFLPSNENFLCYV